MGDNAVDIKTLLAESLIPNISWSPGLASITLRKVLHKKPRV